MTELTEAQKEFIAALGMGAPDRVDNGYPGDTMVVHFGTMGIAVTNRDLRMNREPDRMRRLAKLRFINAGRK